MTSLGYEYPGGETFGLLLRILRKFIIILLSSASTICHCQSTVLKNVNVIDVIQDTINWNCSIEIRDGIIHKIHKTEYIPNSKDYVLDLRDKYAIPGLIDSHTHIERSAYCQNPDRNDLLALLRHALLGGVTTIREMYSDARVVGELSRAAKLNLIASPDIFYASLFAGSKFFVDPSSDAMVLGVAKGQASWLHIINENSDIPNLVAQAKGNGSSAIKLYAFLCGEEIRAITREAHNQNLAVWAHAYTQFSKPSELIESGVDGLSHAVSLLYEFNDMPKDSKPAANDKSLSDLFVEMKTHNISFDPTIFSYVNVERARRWSGIAKSITQKAYDAGVLIIAGTDSISAYQDEILPFLHMEMEYYSRDCGFSNMDALKTATINAALSLKIDNITGSIEEQKKSKPGNIR